VVIIIIMYIINDDGIIDIKWQAWWQNDDDLIISVMVWKTISNLLRRRLVMKENDTLLNDSRQYYWRINYDDNSVNDYIIDD